MRNRAAFKDRVELWMRELVHAVVSVQESAVTELPRRLQGGRGASLPPLPLGPKERNQFGATGGRETATAERLGLDSSMRGSRQRHPEGGLGQRDQRLMVETSSDMGLRAPAVLPPR